MKPKKILLMSDFAFPVTAGTERLVFGIAEYFTNSLGIQADILCPDWDNRGLFEQPQGVNIFRFKTHSIYHSNPIQRVFGFVKKAMELEKYDYYHGFYTMPPLLSSVIAAKLKLSKSAITIFGRDQIDPSFSNPVKKLFLQPTLSSANVVTAYNWKLAQYIKKFFPNKEIFVTLGFSGKEFTRTLQNSPKQHIVLYVGRMNAQKGVFFLLDAFSRIAKKTKARLVLVGPPYELEKVNAEIARLGINEFVDVLGFVSDEKLNELYNSAALVAMPSLFSDSFGLSLIEAVCCGKPVISTDSLGIPGVSGEVIVKKGDVDGLASAIEKLLTDDAYYRSAQNAAMEMAVHFSKEKVMETYLKAYQSAK